MRGFYPITGKYSSIVIGGEPLDLDINIDVLFSLDVSSTSTGYSIIKKGRFRKVNKYFGKIMPDKKLDLAEKLSYFRSELVKLLEKYKPTCVAIEDVFVGRVNSAIILSRFSGVAIETVYTTTGIKPILMESSKVRRILSAGRKKEETFNYIITRFNITDWDFSTTNDIVDSIALGLAVIKDLKDGSPGREDKKIKRKKRKSRKNGDESGGKKEEKEKG